MVLGRYDIANAGPLPLRDIRDRGRGPPRIVAAWIASCRDTSRAGGASCGEGLTSTGAGSPTRWTVSRLSALGGKNIFMSARSGQGLALIANTTRGLDPLKTGEWDERVPQFFEVTRERLERQDRAASPRLPREGALLDSVLPTEPSCCRIYGTMAWYASRARAERTSPRATGHVRTGRLCDAQESISVVRCCLRGVEPSSAPTTSRRRVPTPRHPSKTFQNICNQKHRSQELRAHVYTRRESNPRRTHGKRA